MCGVWQGRHSESSHSPWVQLGCQYRSSISFATIFLAIENLQCNQLSTCEWDARGVVFALARVESLSISLSDRLLNETAHDVVATGDPPERMDPIPDANNLISSPGELKKQADEDGNFSGLVALVNGCKQLRRFELRRCYVRRRGPDLRNNKREEFVQYLVGVPRLKNLEVVPLSNLWRESKT